MLRLADIRIGTKLAAMSGLAILLMLAMLGSQMWGNASVRGSSETAGIQQRMAHDLIAAKELAGGIATAVRDIRLASSSELLQSATKTLDDRHRAAHKWLDPLPAKLRIAENRQRVEKLETLVDQYAAGAKEIAAMQAEAIALQAKGGAETAARIVELNQRAARFARERTLPIAAEIETLIEQVEQSASALADKEIANAEQQMTSAERIGLAIGLLAVVVLVGAAMFGARSIARPLARMASVLNDLSNDRIVEVPYRERGDEVGAIAKATEVFKELIAQKVINFRVRAALDCIELNVMISDADYNIIYMNTSLQKMLRESEPELRKVLPAFDGSKLIGVNMDVFHRNPAHQRKVLDGLTGTIETHIAVGSQKFHLYATAVIDQSGKRAGTCVEWKNETVQKAIEVEVDALVQAAVAGDFSERLPIEGKQGFMLTLAQAMNKLCENTAGALDDMVRMLEAMAEGDLTRRIDADYQGMFGRLKNDANTMAERIGSTISEIKSSAREVTNASSEISTSTTDLSQRTEEQAASLEQTSASMEEMSATVKKNAENAQQANASAATTRNVADRGGQVVAKAVEAMARIEDSSRKISDIIGVIDEIARQTNLLALNAAVEAARAGEAGRGFAVVASEVRSLAQRSSQAAKDIKDLITNSNGQVKEGVDLVNEAGKSLGEIVESIKTVAGIVSDIAAASAEQATGIEEVNKALNQMDEVTQQNSALVEENAATAKTLEQQAAAMDARVAFFRLDDGEAISGPLRARAVAAPARKGVASAPRPAASACKPAARGGPVGRMQAALATAVAKDPDWKEF